MKPLSLTTPLQNLLFSLLCMSLFPACASTEKPLTVDLISVSSAVDDSRIEPIVSILESNGLRVNTGYFDQVVSDLGYVNQAEQRVESLVKALTNSDSDFVWFIRGGAGAFNLMPALMEKRDILASHSPKPVVGYSDVTAIHNFVNQQLGWSSVHGIVAAYSSDTALLYERKYPREEKGSVSNGRSSISQLIQAMKHGMEYQHLTPLNNAANGGVSGELRGGNLTLVQASIGTPHQPDLSGKILLLEDVNEGYRKIDRVLHQLEYANNLNAAAVVFGQFHPRDADDAERLIYKHVLVNYAKRVNIPVYYYPFFGHGDHNKPVFLGKEARLACDQTNYCSFKQDALLK